MKPMSRAVLATSLALLLAACAGSPDEESALAETRDAYAELSGNRLVQNAAPTELFEAEQALRRAEAAESDAERQHQLYLAQQYMNVARNAAERASVEQQTQALADERERLRLAAREREVVEARSRTEQLEAELAALEAKRTERGLMVKLDDVFFETDKAMLNPGAEPTIEKLATILQHNPDQQIVIEGHTDSTGPESYNQQLSQRRADSVQQALVQRGADPQRIQTRGYGESRPIASNRSSGGRQLNRRVEIIFPDAD